jgi:MFS-type transporter involved in bile tolerance (Atg22 family)
VILQYPVGVLADKKLGEKEMLIFGILIMGISAGSIFFIETNSVLVWGGMLFITRIGASMVEILRDSYFYKIIDGRDMDIISFFRTATPVGYMVATALSALLLVIMPVKFVFLLIAAIVLMGLYPALKLVDNKCEAEMK